MGYAKHLIPEKNMGFFSFCQKRKEKKRIKNKIKIKKWTC